MAAASQPGLLLRLVNGVVFSVLDAADLLMGLLLGLLDRFLLPTCAYSSCPCKLPSHQAGPSVLRRSKGQDCGCWGLKSEVGGLALTAPGPGGRPLVRAGSQYCLDQQSATGVAPSPVKWTDCRCKACLATHESHQKTGHLFVRTEGDSQPPPDGGDVIFLHGNLSSSSFWGDTLLPHFSPPFLTRHRLLLPDLLGLGQSPRPHACLYTIGEHLAALERSVLLQEGVGEFHLVGHSMGSLLCLALAAKYPHRVRSLTLLAPVYIAPQPGVAVCEALMKQWAPKSAWPPKDFALSFICHYYHLSRAFCFALCAHHWLWEPPLVALMNALAPRRCPPSLVGDFMQHSHESAWHMFHNTIRGGAHILEPALECLLNAKVPIQVVHGRHDVLCPYESGVAMQARFENVHFKGLPDANHVTVVLGREEQAAHDVEVQIERAEQRSQ